VLRRRNDTILAAVCIGLLSVCLLGGCASEEDREVELYLDGVMLREMGQNKLAIEKLEQVVTLNERFTLAYSELGKAYQAVGDFQKASAVLRKAITLDPSSFHDHMDLARVYEKRERFAPAAAAYDKAGQLKPEDFDAQFGAARCFLKAERPAKALSHCEAARDLDKTSRQAAVLLAQIYEGQGAYVKAAEVYRQALAVHKDDPDFTQALGLAYIKAEEFELARDAFTLLLSIRPDGPAYRNLAFCFLKVGNSTQAMQMYQKALGLDGEDWEAHRGLGVALMIKADELDDERLRVAAVQHWRQALAINPKQPKRQTLEKLIREHSKPTNPLEGTR